MEPSQQNFAHPGQETKLCRHCKKEIPKNAKVCPYCRKKQGGRLKWIVIGIAAVLVLLAAVSGGSENEAGPASAGNSQVTATEPPAQSEPAVTDGADTAPETEPSAEPEPTEEPQVQQTRYESGMYLVGTDMPAGEYVLFADRTLGYMEVDSDSSGDFESILCNDNFTYNTIVTVQEGNYLSMNGAYAVPIDEATLDTAGNGMFKVGVHIPAGEYRIVLDDDASVGLGYVEVATDSSHDFNSIRTNDNIESSTYITVNDGEYLTLDRCHIEQ